jgi:hypothetical protein
MDIIKIDNLLELINNTVSENCAVFIYIPSISQPVALKALTISQQKILISAAIDTEVYNSKFIQIFHKIIIENYLSESVYPVKQLTILDKIFIALALRANINNTLSLQNIQVNLAVVLEQLKNLIQSNNIPITSGECISDNITVKYAIPTIFSELECEEAKVVLTTEDPTEKFKHILAETVTDELSKFITSVTMKDTTIVLSDYTGAERKKIIEQLPANILEQVLNYILLYKQSIEKALTVSDDTNTNTIQINSSFFATA